MSSTKLIQLPKFTYTSLDYDTIVDDIKNLIREHPEYNESWDDFLESNSGRMFTEITSYIIEKNTSKTDWNAKELFLSTATQRQSLINILQLINHRPYLPKASSVSIKAKLTKWIPGFQLPLREKIVGLDTDGVPVNFELIRNNDDTKPDYEYVYNLDTGDINNKVVEIFNIPFYQGNTVVEDDIYLQGIDNEKVVLLNYPVIENSVRVASLTRSGFPEFPEVESFISPEAQQNEILESDRQPPYTVKIDDINRATITFANASMAPVPKKGEKLEITYRTGGGIRTNVVAGSINQSKTYVSGTERVTIIFSNPDPASGGSDEERLEDAKLTAPISLRSANKTVTREDYIVHLEKISSVMKANIVGKENEPSEIYTEYGYKLPPLDTWIYVVPERPWADIDPYEYNKSLQISQPYDRYGHIDYEDISLTPIQQTVYIHKYKKYKGYTMYVTLHETSAECTEYLASDSYEIDTDYTIDTVTAEFIRISTAEGGTIPSGDRTLRIRWIYSDTILEHKNNTVQKFYTSGTDEIIMLDTTINGLYPQTDIVITSINGEDVYEIDIDYTIDWENNKIYRVNSGSIDSLEEVIIYYSNHWAQNENDLSEEKIILEGIKDKRMICVDNYIKDSLYTPFDVVGKVYCYKNMRSRVQNDLEDYLRSYYSLLPAKYNTHIIKAEIIAITMRLSGVRFVEIEYLGKNYDSYRKYVLDELTLQELEDLNANKVEFKIEAKYNEILVLANDEWSGTQIVENKRHGGIFTYYDA